MRIALIGRGAFGEAVLEQLLAQGEEVVCVSAPCSARGASADPLFARACALGLPVFPTRELAQPEVTRAFLAAGPELNVMAYVTTILPEALLHAPRLGSIEYHPSLLPRHRGASAVNWAIIQGEAQTGFSIFWPDGVVDGGPILLQRELTIEPSDNAGSLLARLFPLGVAGLAEAVTLVRSGRAPRSPQLEADATTEPRLRDGDGAIDFRMPAQRVHDFVRGVTPRPGARTSVRGLVLEVLETAVETSAPPAEAREPGSILACDDDGITVSCASGSVRLRRLRAEPVGRCSAAALSAALGLQPGEPLGKTGDDDGRAASIQLERALGAPASALAANAPGSLCKALEAAEPERRAEPLREGLIELASVVLRVPRAELTPDASLQNLGLDSILAVELRSRVETALRAAVPASLFLQGLPLAQLCGELLAAWERRTGEAADEPNPLVPDAGARFEPFPLTDIQHSYWVGRQGILPWGNLPTHLYAELDGSLDPARLERAWSKMIERHDALRLVVQSDGQQRVLEQTAPYRIQIVDLRQMDVERTEAQIEALRSRMTRELPDLEWPRFEIVLQLLPAGRTKLHFNLDMLVADMFSVGLLFEDWGQLYAQPETRLPAIEVSFRDYVLAERRLLEGDAGRAALEHWRGRIPSLPPAPALPRPYRVDLNQVRTPRIQHYATRLSAAEWGALHSCAKAHGLTPAVVLCSALCETLACFCDRQRQTLNLTQARRLPLHADIGRVVGDFTSTLLLECDWSGDGNFVQRAQRLARQLWSDLNHSLASGVQVLQQMDKASGEVLMPVVLTSALNDLSTMNWAGTLQSLIIETSQVYFDNRIHECNGELLVYWDIVPEFFPAGLIAQMFDEYRALLARLASGDAETWQGSRRALTATRWQAAAAYNATARSLPEGLLHTLGRRHVVERPEAPAVIAPDRELSYRELYARAAALGLELRAHGVRPNQLVAVMTHPGWQRAVSALGVLESGAGYLPVDPLLPPERQRYLLQSAAVRVAVSHASALPALALPEGVTVLDVDTLGTFDGFLEPAQTPDDLAYVIHTSGSSGIPKGVMLAHRGPVNTVLDVNRRFGIGPDDRVLALSNLSFDLSVWDIFGLLAAGGSIVYPDADAGRDPARWLEIAQRSAVSVWNSVPALFELLVAQLEGTRCAAPESLRLALLSGDWIPVALPDRARSFLPDLTLISLGGATEASVWSIYHPIAEVDPDWTSIPYGRPLANQRLYVLDERLQPCPTWTAGQLYIAGTGLAQGYWGDPTTSTARFFQHPDTGERLYATGDRGRHTDRGEIEFLGREDTQVKIQGYRIELGEIEAALLLNPAVRDARVLVFDAAAGSAPQAAQPGPRSSERYLVAYVRRSSSELREPELLAQLRERLPDYMLPRCVLFVAAWPLTANGKLDLSALPHPDQSMGRDAARVRPENALEAQLLEIWALLLDCNPDTLGTTESFFDRGGNSLRLVKLAAEISQRLHRECRIADLFQHPSIQGMARALSGSAAAVSAVQQRARDRAAKRASLRGE